MSAYSPGERKPAGLRKNLLRAVFGVLLLAAAAQVAHGQNVLFFWDQCDGGTDNVTPALTNLGISSITTVTDAATFETQLAAGSWDVVIVDSYGSDLPSSTLDALVTYYDGGGSIIFSWWNLYSQAAHPFVSRAGVTLAGEYFAQQAVYVWDASTLFTTPNSVPDMTLFTDWCNRDGQYVQPVTATAHGGYSAAPSPNQAAVTVNSTGRLILNAFAPQNFSADEDGDGKTDMVELYENEISAFLGNLSVTPITPLVSSGPVGGPFSPICSTYTLANISSSPFDWATSWMEPWLTVTPSSGTLSGGTSTTIIVSINDSANSLTRGPYEDTVTFTDPVSGYSVARSVSLAVGRASVHRHLPAFFSPGVPVTVHLVAAPGASGEVVVVESVPTSLTLGTIVSSTGTVTTSGSTITWTPTVGATTETLTYEVTHPAGVCSPKVHSFSGTFTADPWLAMPIAGDTDLARIGEAWQGAPIAWAASQTIGGGLPLGSADWYSCDDSYMLYGAGHGIGDIADDFHFLYAYVLGDFALEATVDLQLVTHEWTKAGLIVRANNTPGSPYVFVAATGGGPDTDPYTPGNQGGNRDLCFQWRDFQDDWASWAGAAVGNNDQAILRLERSGSNVICGFDNLEGSVQFPWDLHGLYSSPLDSPFLVGLALSSHSPGQLARSAFSNVTLSGNIVTFLVTPSQSLWFEGPAGGPFEPSWTTYTLSNVGTSAVSWGATWSQPWLTVAPDSGMLLPGTTATAIVWINSAARGLARGLYNDTVTFTDQTSGLSWPRSVSLVVGRSDYFTEMFDWYDNDLDYMSLTFSLDGSDSFYSVCREPATTFPTDPTGGTVVYPGEDGWAYVSLSGGRQVSLHGVSYNSFYVGSNGYITFTAGDYVYWVTLDWHFVMPRISVLFDDFSPQLGGTVSWKQLPDRVAVTYQNVPQYWSADSNNFQVEMFFDGTIRMTYLRLDSQDGLAGLSAGQGIPWDFLESDLSGYGLCDAMSVAGTSLFSSGFVGGPFSPVSTTYTVINNGSTTLDWTAAWTQSWLDLLPVGGTLAAGVSAAVVVSLNDSASSLALGTYADTITFTNVGTGFVSRRPAVLQVMPTPAVESATRDIAATTYTLGQPIHVVIDIRHRIDSSPLRVIERVPESWMASAISHGGSQTGTTITWTLAAFTADTQLSYNITPMAGDQPGYFSGVTRDQNGVEVVVGGDRVVRKAGVKHIIYLRDKYAGDYATHDGNIIAALGTTGLTLYGITIPPLGYGIIEVQQGEDAETFTAQDGDLIFVSQTIGPAAIKYHTDDPLPIVMTEWGLFDNDMPPSSDMYFSESSSWVYDYAFNIVDVSHPITSFFTPGFLVVNGYGYGQIGMMTDTISTAVSVLALSYSYWQPCLAVAEAGATGFVNPPRSYEPSPARRVCLGYDAGLMAYPTPEGTYLLQRTVQWAMGDAVTAGECPYQPTHVSPPAGATGLPTILLLQSSPFSAPRISDTHAASQWQISASSDFSAAPPIVWDSGPTLSSLTWIVVPDGVLNAGTIYFWRVRHQGSLGLWSPWSVPTHFQTAPALTATIAGRVTDSSTSAAVSSAFIVVQYGADSSVQTNSNTQGYYSVQVTGDRTCTVSVTATGYVGQRTGRYVAAGATTTVNFALAPQNGTISGRVIQAGTSDGIASATVALAGGTSVYSNAYGYFTMLGVAPGYDKTVTASATGYRSQQIGGIVVYAGQTTVVYFSLPVIGGATVRGYVRDQATLAAIAGARVAIIPGSYRTYTDSVGFYTLSAPPGSGYSIQVQAASYNATTTGPLELLTGETYAYNFRLVREHLPPAVPTGLVATAGDYRVDLSWNPNSELDLVGYNVYREDRGTTPVNTALITGATYQDLGLNIGTTYTYCITAVDLDSLESSPSATAWAIPFDAPPEPVSGLRASLFPMGVVALQWNPSPSNDAASYHVYSDFGTGVIGYDTDVGGSPVTSPTTAWVSQPLARGVEHKFAVRVEDRRRNLEQNQTVVIRVTPVDQISGSAKVRIASPTPGMTVQGDHVSVYAEPVAGFEAGLDAVRFEVFYQGYWRSMATQNATHNNPDDQHPHYLLWDTRSLPDGTYDIRAVAIDVNGVADGSPMGIQVVVNNSAGAGGGGTSSLAAGADLREAEGSSTAPIDIAGGLTPYNEYQSHHRVYRSIANRAFIGSAGKDQMTSLTLPAGALERDTKLRVTLLDANRFRSAHSLKVQQGQTSDTIDCAIDEFTEVLLESGQTTFAVPAQMTVPYSDVNNDGWIDGYVIREEQLVPVLIDSKGNLTELSYTSDSLKNNFVVQLSKTGTVGLIVKLDANVAIASAVPTPEPRWFRTGLFLGAGGAGEGALRPGSHTPQVLPGASAVSGRYRWAEIRSLGGNMTWFGQTGHPYDPPVITGPPGTGLPASADFFAPGLSQFGLYFRVGETATSRLAQSGAVLSGEGEIYITVNTFKTGSLGQIGTYAYELVLHTQAPSSTRASPAWMLYR